MNSLQHYLLSSPVFPRTVDHNKPMRDILSYHDFSVPQLVDSFGSHHVGEIVASNLIDQGVLYSDYIMLHWPSSVHLQH